LKGSLAALFYFSAEFFELGSHPASSAAFALSDSRVRVVLHRLSFSADRP
jgi:hypothetical protein